MNLTNEQITTIARISEQHGAEVIEVYLFGDRAKGEILWLWDKECARWVNCFKYPWEIENVGWAEFYIGENPNG